MKRLENIITAILPWYVVAAAVFSGLVPGYGQRLNLPPSEIFICLTFIPAGIIGGILIVVMTTIGLTMNFLVKGKPTEKQYQLIRSCGNTVLISTLFFGFAGMFAMILDLFKGVRLFEPGVNPFFSTGKLSLYIAGLIFGPPLSAWFFGRVICFRFWIKTPMLCCAPCIAEWGKEPEALKEE